MSKQQQKKFDRVEQCTTFEEVESNFPLLVEEARAFKRNGPDDRTMEDMDEVELALILEDD